MKLLNSVYVTGKQKTTVKREGWSRGKKSRLPFDVYVVVNFLSQVIFVFLLFLGMEMYANEVETKEKEKLAEIKN